MYKQRLTTAMAARQQRRDGRSPQKPEGPGARLLVQKKFERFLVTPPCTDGAFTAFEDLVRVTGPAEPHNGRVFQAFQEIDRDVQAAKARLDPYESDPELAGALRAVFPYAGLRGRIVREFGAQVVTNAWLKMYEIATQMGLFDAARAVTSEGSALRVFCNAELPGAFVSALNHYACTWYPNMRYDWVASSLYPERGLAGRASPADALGDHYGLYARNPDRWLMDAGMRGDVTDVVSIQELARRAKDKLGEVDLYTSDVGIDVSEDYAGQERMTARLNLGQIVVGLISLRVGGALVAKTYTFTRPYSLSVLGLCATLFNAFYVTKPRTSRAANSETYLVGIGFRGLTEEAKEFLLRAVQNYDDSSVPLFPLGYSGAEHTVLSLLTASVQIHQSQQVAVLLEAVAFFEAYRGKLGKLRQDVQPVVSKAERRWLEDNPVKRLPKLCFLRDNGNPRAAWPSKATRPR